MPRAWTPSEDAICRAAIATGLDCAATQEELAKWGYHRSLEGVASHLQTVRRQIRADATADQQQADREMLKYSISRKWL